LPHDKVLVAGLQAKMLPIGVMLSLFDRAADLLALMLLAGL